MKVTKELKNVLRRRLQKVYNGKKDKKNQMVLTKYKKISDKLDELNKLKKQANQNFDKYRLSVKENDEIYVSYDGRLDANNQDIDFDIDEHLYTFIEEIELSNDKEGILKSILQKIKNL